MFSFLPTKFRSETPKKDEVVSEEMPQAVRDKLAEVGVNGDALLHVHGDLNTEGSWGERYLVATPRRVLVLSVEDDEGKTKRVTIDFDVPLEEIAKTEAKGLVGTSTLEARVRPHQNGNGSDARVAPDKIVELLRASNARAKELNHAARQLEHLREHGSLADEVPQDEKWHRQVCKSCGRALTPDSEVCRICSDKWEAMRRLFRYLGPYKWKAISNGILSVLTIGLDFVSLGVVKVLIDQVFPHDNGKVVAPMPFFGVVNTPEQKHALLAWLVGAIVLGSFLSSALGVIRGRTGAFLGAHVLHDVRAQLYAHLQRLSLAYYDKREVGAVMSRVQSDVGMLQNFLLDGAENIILSTLTIAAIVVMMLINSWSLTLWVLIPVPFIIIGTNGYWRGLMKLWRRVWHQNSMLGAGLADVLSGVRVVRAFAQENREVNRFMNKSGELRDATMGVETKAATFYPIMGFITGLGLPLLYFFGGAQVLNGSITLGTLFLFTALLSRLNGPVQQLTRLVNFTTRAMTAAERVFEVLDTQPEINEKPDAVAMPHVEGHVEFKDVIFGYDRHRPVMKGISFSAEPGEMIGLVGHSGAGKSTLINLLMRFYDVDEGRILIDGVDLRDIKRDDLRSQIGVVLQEPYLFHGTVYDNIAYAKPDADPSEIMAAAKAAYAHNFIVGFPDGYDTIVGERGTRLSGGERQRISIARAILHNPRILILDEATASVDTETESQIQQALQNLVKGRTVFAIAHRLSTLRNANRLLVLDGGKIAEQGTHDELMQKRGAFYKLVSTQQSMNEICAVGG